MTRKKNISKIITSGSFRQRLLLYFENNALLSFGEEPILTKAEGTALFDSVKTPTEKTKWNDFLDDFQKIFQAIQNLNKVHNLIKFNYSEIRGYIFLWYSYENMELLANSVLHEIKSKKERKKIAKNSIRSTSLFSLIFARPAVDPEGYIEIYNAEKTNKNKEQYRIKEILESLNTQASENIIAFLSLHQATLEYMEERNINIKAYKDKLNKYLEGVNTPIIDLNKYRSDKRYFYEGVSGLNVRLNKLKHIYNVTPNLDKLGPDNKMVKTIKERLFYE